MFKFIRFIKDKIKYIVAALLVLWGVVTTGIATNKTHQLKEADTNIALLQQQIIERNELITKLAALEAVHCEVSIAVKNTAVMGSTKNGDIAQEAEQISTYLRGEILDKITNK